MPLTPRRAAGWRPRGTRAPETGTAGPADRAGGRRRRRRRGAPCAPRGARLGPPLAPAGARGALSGDAGHPAARAQALGRAARVPDLPRAAGQLRRRARGLHEARRGAGQGRRRGPAPPPRPAAGTAPRTRAGRLCPPMARRGRREGDGDRRKFAEEPPRRRARRPCEAASPGERPRCSGSVRPGAGTRALAHAGWHRHNPPAGVTGALLPAAETCPRYGACAEARRPRRSFQGRSPRRGGLREAPGGGNPFCLGGGEAREGKGGAREAAGRAWRAPIEPSDHQLSPSGGAELSGRPGHGDGTCAPPAASPTLDFRRAGWPLVSGGNWLQTAFHSYPRHSNWCSSFSPVLPQRQTWCVQLYNFIQPASSPGEVPLCTCRVSLRLRVQRPLRSFQRQIVLSTTVQYLEYKKSLGVSS